MEKSRFASVCLGGVRVQLTKQEKEAVRSAISGVRIVRSSRCRHYCCGCNRDGVVLRKKGVAKKKIATLISEMTGIEVDSVDVDVAVDEDRLPYTGGGYYRTM